MAANHAVVISLMMVVCLLEYGSPYRILVVSPTPARSHYNLGKAVVDILQQRGHEITFITSFVTKNPRYREIVTPELMDYKDSSIVNFEMSQQSTLQMMREQNGWISRMIEGLFRNQGVRELFSDKTEHFDVVIVEFFMNDLLLGLGVKYGCPVIPLSPLPMGSWLAALTGSPQRWSSSPNILLPHTARMDLAQRTANLLASVYQGVIGLLYILPVQKRLYENLLPEEARRVPYSALRSHISLVLVNSHPSLAAARPLPPNVVEVGGFHIGEHEPLPKDLQQRMDSAIHGVVFFSMGSNLNSSSMPHSMRDWILQTLGTLDQLVLWKLEEEVDPVPDNVIIRGWLPQLGILAHPNTKLFVTHGGLLSYMEGAHNGVPLLAIPVFGDQHHNAANILEKGVGLRIQYDNLTRESLRWAVEEILHNPEYAENARRLQGLFHDRPTPPRESVAFYAEHVVRTKGAAHLSSSVQSWLLDLPLLALAAPTVLLAPIVLLTPIVLLFALAILCKKCCGNSRRKECREINGNKIKYN